MAAPTAPSGSFATVAGGAPPGLVSVSLGEVEGVPAAFISDEDMLLLARPFSRTLIGKFGCNRPPVSVIRSFILRLKLFGPVQIDPHDKVTVTFRFSDDRDYRRFFARRVFTVFGVVMRVLKWSPFADLAEEVPIVPLWVSFPGLRFQLFHAKTLMDISKIFGNPLCVDLSTANLGNLSQARVLVEIDVSRPIPDRVWIGSLPKGAFQSVIVEDVPPYCSLCSSFAHGGSMCCLAAGAVSPSPSVPLVACSGSGLLGPGGSVAAVSNLGLDTGGSRPPGPGSPPVVVGGSPVACPSGVADSPPPPHPPVQVEGGVSNPPLDPVVVGGLGTDPSGVASLLGLHLGFDSVGGSSVVINDKLALSPSGVVASELSVGDLVCSGPFISPIGVSLGAGALEGPVLEECVGGEVLRVGASLECESEVSLEMEPCGVSRGRTLPSYYQQESWGGSPPLSPNVLSLGFPSRGMTTRSQSRKAASSAGKKGNGGSGGSRKKKNRKQRRIDHSSAMARAFEALFKIPGHV